MPGISQRTVERYVKDQVRRPRADLSQCLADAARARCNRGCVTRLSRNEILTDVIARAATLDLPGWYVTAGCLFQTVWNVATGRPPANGIKDYDVFYFDDGDLSW